MPAYLMGTSLGYGRKLEYPDKPTQTWGEHANPTKTVALAGNLFFFSYLCYKETMLNETLFEDLLHLECALGCGGTCVRAGSQGT